MYTLAEYGSMIADKVRTGAFVEAMRRAIRPGAIVVDIGTGTGIFALLACRLGACRVYAIEPSDAIQVAREIAAANGYADRIEFIQAISTSVSLPERADVIVSDIGGVLPWFQQHIPSIVDARRRFLAPGGTLIPQCDAGWAAVIEGRDLYEELTDPWSDNGLGLDMQAARRFVLNTWNRAKVTRESLLTEPRRWATIDYATVEEPNARTCVTWAATRPGTAHGFAAGFDRTVSEGVLLSNAPDAPVAIQPERTYGPVFFPWPAPVALAVDDLITIDLEARLIGTDYQWSWATRILDQGQPDAEKARFRQSTFFGAPLSLASAQKTAASYTPMLNEDGRIARFVLESMNDGLSLGEIARLVSARFSARFAHPEDALNHVGDLSREYS